MVAGFRYIFHFIMVQRAFLLSFFISKRLFFSICEERIKIFVYWEIYWQEIEEGILCSSGGERSIFL